ncbi:MAG: response regulator transcription factor [Bacteroidales bacterium]|nr:response regulator transcription factor [Bacteroidales bacterium]
MSNKGHILLVEDDKNLGYVLKDFLEISSYSVILKENGKEGLNAFINGKYDIILLDIMLPLMDGFTVAEEIRRIDCEVPIIFITAKSMKEDKIKGFRSGADDYLTKPFSTEELSLRINAILRRTKNNPLISQTSHFAFGIFNFDANNHLLKSPTHEKHLTKREAAVLKLLCMNKNRVLRREVALKLIWGDDDYFMGRSMDVYITKLRKFLKEDPSVNIINIHNTGFKLEINDTKKVETN